MSESSEKVRHSGVAFEFGDRTLIVPPLNTADLEKHGDELDAIDQWIQGTQSMNVAIQKASKAGDDEALSKAQQVYNRERSYKLLGQLLREKVAPTIHSALRRNYPNFSIEEVLQFVTALNWAKLYTACLGYSEVTKGESLPAVQSAIQ